MKNIYQNQPHIKQTPQEKWNSKNPEKLREASCRYREKNSEKLKNAYKKWYLENKAIAKAASTRWSVAHPELRRVYRKKARTLTRVYENNKYRNDIEFRLSRVLRSRLNKALRRYINNGKEKSIHTLDLVGCTLSELKKHLESLFLPGMTWNNWGVDGWHIDHYLPFGAFDVSKEEILKEICHFSNLKPMWATENHKKGKKLLVSY